MSTARGVGALALLTLAGLAGCSERPPADIPPDALQEARVASQHLADDLMGKLFAGLDVGGPASAVEICSDMAQARTSDFSTPDLTLRRVSLKYRNPADAPDLFERDQLKRLEELRAQGDMPDEVALIGDYGGQRYLRYMKPIIMARRCLTCHGRPDQVPEEVRTLLEERYPGDRAMGYREGDLRGAVSVMLRLE